MNLNIVMKQIERRKFLARAGALAAGSFLISPDTLKANDYEHPDISNKNARFDSGKVQSFGGTVPFFNVRDYGAIGDGKTLNTKAIQNAIDDCHKNGGGKVYLHKGIFISGTIILKSNVTLYIEAGTILKASNNLEDFPIMPSRYPSYVGNFETNKMLIYAEDASNISIAGRGTIDGNGDHWVNGPYGIPSFSVRPRIIHLRGCENIKISDITLYNSASWVQSYQSCKNLVIDGITVNSRENKDIEKERFADARGRNTDGLDLLDCEKVRISNCYINSGDDAICLKSFSPDEGCRDITITNCVVSSNASGTMNSPELIRLVDTQRVIISESTPSAPVPVFLSVYGKSDEIILLNNFLKNAKQNVVFDNEAINATITESGTFK